MIVDYDKTTQSISDKPETEKPKGKKPRTFFPETWVWNSEKTESVDRNENYKFVCSG